MAELTGFRLTALTRLLGVIGSDLPYGSTLVVFTSRPESALFEQLAALQDAGHGVVLITAGETPPDVPPSIVAYHLGGAERWNELESFELA